MLVGSMLVQIALVCSGIRHAQQCLWWFACIQPYSCWHMKHVNKLLYATICACACALFAGYQHCDTWKWSSWQGRILPIGPGLHTGRWGAAKPRENQAHSGPPSQQALGISILTDRMNLGYPSIRTWMTFRKQEGVPRHVAWGTYFSSRAFHRDDTCTEFGFKTQSRWFIVVHSCFSRSMYSSWLAHIAMGAPCTYSYTYIHKYERLMIEWSAPCTVISRTLKRLSFSFFHHIILTAVYPLAPAGIIGFWEYRVSLVAQRLL